MKRSSKGNWWRSAGIVVAVATFPAVVHADEAAPARALSPEESPSDEVFLRAGGSHRGKITEIVPGDHVSLIIAGGASKTVPWAEVDRIVATNGPSAPPTVIPASPPSSTAPAATASVAASVAEQPLGGEPAPRTEWRANRPLLVTGAILFAAGYAPNVVAGAPSTVGLAGRVVLLVLSLGLPCWFNSSSGYLCNGEHGAVQLLIPFAGPFLFASDSPRDTLLNQSGAPLSGFAKGLLYTSGGLQIAGVASILTGVALGRQELVPGRKASSTSPSFFVAPLGGAGSVGLTVGLHRW